jgi:hypothetical protein
MKRTSKVHVVADDYTNQVKIVPVMETSLGREFLFPTRTVNGFEWESFLLEGDALFPIDKEKNILRMNRGMAEQLRDALVKALGHPEKPAMKAELDATRLHLDDMRVLVFKKEFQFRDAPLRPKGMK